VAAQTTVGDDERLTGEGTLAQALGDLGEPAELGASNVILGANPDHPSRRLPTAEEWRMLDKDAAARATSG
jgi:hypothetical protein